MQNRFARSIATIAAALAISPVILAQTAPQTSQAGAAKATPDLSGVWYRADSAPGIMNPDGSELIPPMQPWAAEVLKARQSVRLSRELDESGKPGGLVDARPFGLAIDPAMSCLAPGFPRVLLAVRTNFEVYQTPGRVVMLFETNRLSRIIYTDGRGFPDGAPPSFMGQSIGKWDGNTLVVETIGLMGDDTTWLDRAGHPHTEALRVTERIRRVDRNTLEIDFLFDDPKAYTKPWGGKQVYKLQPDWELMEAFLCLDHFEEVHLPEIRRLTGARGERR